MPAPDRRDARFVTLRRALLRTAGVAAARRAVPLFAAIGIASAVVFGRNGMQPADLLDAGGGSPAGRAALWGTWVLLAVPAARASLETPATFFLRTLPVPRGHFLAVHAAVLAALQAPWLLLWLFGRGALAVGAAGLVALAAQAVVVSRPEGWRERACAGALAAAVVAGAPLWALATTAALVGPPALLAAWRRAPERGARRHRSAVGGNAVVALALAHAATVRRGEQPALLRALLATLVGAAGTALVARNNGVVQSASLGALAIGIGTLPLAIGAGTAALAAMGAEVRARWLLDTTATSAATRVVAATLVPSSVGAALGALDGALVAGGARAGVVGAARLAGLGAAWGASLGAVTAWRARRAERVGGVDGTSVVAATGLVSLAGIVGAATLGERAVVLAAGLGAAALGAAVRYEQARER